MTKETTGLIPRAPHLSEVRLRRLLELNVLRHYLATTMMDTSIPHESRQQKLGVPEAAYYGVVQAANALACDDEALAGVNYEVRWVGTALVAYRELLDKVPDDRRQDTHGLWQTQSLVPRHEYLHHASFRNMRAAQVEITSGKHVDAVGGSSYANHVGLGQIVIPGGLDVIAATDYDHMPDAAELYEQMAERQPYAFYVWPESNGKWLVPG